MAETDEKTRTRVARGPLVIAAVALAWFAATLWFTHRSVVGAPTPDAAVVTAALALPLVIASALVTGGAVAVVATGRVPRLRALAGAGVGLAVGGAAGGLVLIGYGTAAALVWLAVALAVAAAAGGALAGVRATAVLVAGLAATLAWFGVGVVEGLFNGRLQKLFGAAGSPVTQLAAAGRLSLLAALLGGAVAGLTGYLYLRRTGGDPGWPAFLVAGATPGLLLLAADLATRLGGGPLLRAASRASVADRAALDYVAANRLSTALTVLFTGAIVAMVAHGRTLKPAPATGRAPSGRTTPARGPRRRPR